MPNHADSNPKKREIAPEWMPDSHAKGNNEADSLASVAAELHAIPDEPADIMMMIYTALELVQNRLIQVTKMFPQRTYSKTILGNIKCKPRYKDKIIEKLKTSQYDCVIHEDRLHC